MTGSSDPSVAADSGSTPDQAHPLAHDLALLEQGVGVYVTADKVLRVTGDDRLTWLQGQLTQDVSALTPGAAAYGLLLHPTGKVMADLDVLCRADDVLLLCAADVADEVCAQLDRYIMMEDVELEMLPDALSAAYGPENVFAVDRLGAGGLVLFPPADPSPPELPGAVGAAGGRWVSDQAVTLARLRAGRPQLGADFGPTVLPQVAGLSRRALSFQKGCYRGQEPVVMLEHRGTPPKRLVRLELTGDRAPASGVTLRASDDSALGTLTSAAAGPDGVVYALGLLKRGAELAQVACVGDDDARLPARALEFVE
jgi:folate-binding protein YgfZ